MMVNVSSDLAKEGAEASFLATVPNTAHSSFALSYQLYS